MLRRSHSIASEAPSDRKLRTATLRQQGGVSPAGFWRGGSLGWAGAALTGEGAPGQDSGAQRRSPQVAACGIHVMSE